MKKINKKVVIVTLANIICYTLTNKFKLLFYH